MNLLFYGVWYTIYTFCEICPGKVGTIVKHVLGFLNFKGLSSAIVRLSFIIIIALWRFCWKISYFAENRPVEYSSLRVKTLDGHQIHIFEARVLPSYINLHCIYIWWVVWKKLAKTVRKAIFTLGGTMRKSYRK